MDVFSATDDKREFGEMLMRAQKAPVGVTRNGKPIAVIVSEIEYQALKLQALRLALIEGEQSGDAGRLDMQTIKAKAMQKAVLNG